MWKFKVGILLIIVSFLMGSLYIFSGTFILSGGALHYLTSSVGVSLGVEENMYNRVAQQLQEKAEELDGREVSLRELEEEIINQIKEEKKKDRVALAGLSVFTGISSVLLLTNFYYDRRRLKVINELKR